MSGLAGLTGGLLGARGAVSTAHADSVVLTGVIIIISGPVVARAGVGGGRGGDGRRLGDGVGGGDYGVLDLGWQASP